MKRNFQFAIFTIAMLALAGVVKADQPATRPTTAPADQAAVVLAKLNVSIDLLKQNKLAEFFEKCTIRSEWPAGSTTADMTKDFDEESATRLVGILEGFKNQEPIFFEKDGVHCARYKVGGLWMTLEFIDGDWRISNNQTSD